ncbi:MAG: molybdate ABC transporter substrate-binding protein [Myxococcota bacterium]
MVRRGQRRLRTAPWVLVLVACADPGVPPSLEVFAASSLTDALPAVSAAFERLHPGVRVRHSFAGSQVLRLQLEEGADADVFVSADPRQLEALQQAGRLVAPRVVAEVPLVLALAEEAPALSGLEELPRVKRLVLGTPGVPIGRYARALLDAAASRYGEPWRRSVDDRVVSEESNVRLVRAKLLLGEADAAFLYASDLVGATALRAVALPDFAPRARLGAGRLRRSGPAAAKADAYLAFLASPAAQAILARHGLRRAASAAPDGP